MATAPAPVADPNVLSFELPESAGNFTVSLDMQTIPAATRLDLLKRAVTQLISGRVNVALSRVNKANEAFIKYDEALAAHTADPITVPAPALPEGERTPPVDVAAKVSEGIAALQAGKLTREKSESTSRRVARDPVDAIVTGVVQRELFAKNKAANPSYKWTDVVKEVGASGVAYLNKRIETLVAGGADRGQLEAMLDAKYIAPARIQAGVTPLTGKKSELPNIL
jgi:hypothetical protein